VQDEAPPPIARVKKTQIVHHMERTGVRNGVCDDGMTTKSKFIDGPRSQRDREPTFFLQSYLKISFYAGTLGPWSRKVGTSGSKE